jgi:hypothetical protein
MKLERFVPLVPLLVGDIRMSILDERPDRWSAILRLVLSHLPSGSRPASAKRLPGRADILSARTDRTSPRSGKMRLELDSNADEIERIRARAA